MSELLTNLNTIYNTKLQIKSAIGTESDIFTDYPTYITNLKPNGYTYLTENGSYNISAYEYAYVNVESGGITPTGYIDIEENGDYDISSYAYAYVSISSEDSGDVLYNKISLDSYINGWETGGIGLETRIDEDFYFDQPIDPETGDPDGDFTCYWTQYTDGIKSKIEITSDSHNIINIGNEVAASFDDFPNLYENMFPILTNIEISYLTEPDNNGFSYYVTGDLWAWNICDNIGFIEITENGLYYTSEQGVAAWNVNVEGGSTPTGYITVSQNGNYDVSSYEYAYVNVQSGGTAYTTYTIGDGNTPTYMFADFSYQLLYNVLVADSLYQNDNNGLYLVSGNYGPSNIYGVKKLHREGLNNYSIEFLDAEDFTNYKPMVKLALNESQYVCYISSYYTWEGNISHDPNEDYPLDPTNITEFIVELSNNNIIQGGVD